MCIDIFHDIFITCFRGAFAGAGDVQPDAAFVLVFVSECRRMKIKYDRLVKILWKLLYFPVFMKRISGIGKFFYKSLNS